VSDLSPAMPRFGSIERASDYFGLSRSSIYELLAEGKLIARKFGRKTLIDFAHAAEFMNGLPRADIRMSERRAA
jgi:excisionase family DNA binding protein